MPKKLIEIRCILYLETIYYNLRDRMSSIKEPSVDEKIKRFRELGDQAKFGGGQKRIEEQHAIL